MKDPILRDADFAAFIPLLERDDWMFDKVLAGFTIKANGDDCASDVCNMRRAIQARARPVVTNQ